MMHRGVRKKGDSVGTSTLNEVPTSTPARISTFYVWLISCDRR